MKKYLSMFVFGLLLLANNVFADPGLGTVQKVFDSVTIASTGGTVTTVALPVKSAGYFGVWYQAVSSTSTPDLKIEYQMAYDSTPSTIFAEPVGASDIVTNLTSEEVQIESINPPPMSYLRIKAEGNSGNATNTVLNMYLFKQE